MSIWQQIEKDISEHIGKPFHILEKHSIAGGDINNAFKVNDEKQAYFVKTNRQKLAYMFEAEARALQELHQTHSIKVPEPVSFGVSGHECYFVMKWIDLSGSPGGQQFGQKMAELHQNTNEQFGFYLDNTIGSTHQLNQWSNDWVDFWQKQRLGYQLDLAKQNGFGGQLFSLGLQLIEKTPLFFETYKPVASLLHGDLWAGNWSSDEKGFPVIFDPASYYGDREADLAMMELFGHPGRQFFDAYNEVFPVDEGYSMRRKFYNVYHILNHANLFGGSYAMQAQNMIEDLLAEVG